MDMKDDLKDRGIIYEDGDLRNQNKNDGNKTTDNDDILNENTDVIIEETKDKEVEEFGSPRGRSYSDGVIGISLQSDNKSSDDCSEDNSFVCSQSNFDENKLTTYQHFNHDHVEDVNYFEPDSIIENERINNSKYIPIGCQPSLKIEIIGQSNQDVLISTVERKQIFSSNLEKINDYVHKEEKMSRESRDCTSDDTNINSKDMHLSLSSLNKVYNNDLPKSKSENYNNYDSSNKNNPDIVCGKSVLHDYPQGDISIQLNRDVYLREETVDNINLDKLCKTDYQDTDVENVLIVNKLNLRSRKSKDLRLEDNVNSKELPTVSKVRKKATYVLKSNKKCLYNDKVQKRASFSKNQVIKCCKCGKIYSNSIILERHLVTHLLIKPYSCLYCDFETSYKSSLYYHKRCHPEYKLPLKKLKLSSKIDTDIYANETTGNNEVAKVIESYCYS